MKIKVYPYYRNKTTLIKSGSHGTEIPYKSFLILDPVDKMGKTQKIIYPYNAKVNWIDYYYRSTFYIRIGRKRLLINISLNYYSLA